ncbi:hypothetical protein [Polystyrenella longa]|uniref:hypothetical protein n=1 Tax=Polystyrenella longa TaxID=2528007 RepID=UPI0011A50679|nr:hypothetical protein [Polystyrenella longa]
MKLPESRLREVLHSAHLVDWFNQLPDDLGSPSNCVYVLGSSVLKIFCDKHSDRSRRESETLSLLEYEDVLTTVVENKGNFRQENRGSL